MTEGVGKENVGKDDKSDDIGKTALEAFKDRISDPLIFSFLVSMLVSNWDCVFYTASTMPVESKIASIRLAFSDWSVLWSVVIAAFYTFAYPYFKFHIVNFWIERCRFTAEAKGNRLKGTGWITDSLFKEMILYRNTVVDNIENLEGVINKIIKEEKDKDNDPKSINKIDAKYLDVFLNISNIKNVELEGVLTEKITAIRRLNLDKTMDVVKLSKIRYSLDLKQ